MSSLNKVTIIGNVGGEPEMRFTGSGKTVVNFGVAVNDKFGEEEHTEWFSIVAWNKLAETCNQYLTKGRQVYVEGRQQTRKWDGEDGQTHYKTELIASSVVFLGKRENIDKPAADELEPDDLQF